VGARDLNFDAFRLAVRTLTSTHAHEDLTDEELLEDFYEIDTNKSGTIGFHEVRLASHLPCSFARGACSLGPLVTPTPVCPQQQTFVLIRCATFAANSSTTRKPSKRKSPTPTCGEKAL
jgi:hypothetical protein